MEVALIFFNITLQSYIYLNNNNLLLFDKEIMHKMLYICEHFSDLLAKFVGKN